MIALTRALQAEHLKIRRSLALVLAIIAPLAMVVLSVLNFLRAQAFFSFSDLDGWEWLIRNSFGLWALLLLPLFIALQAALLGGLEHQKGGWKHLFALPIPRTSVYIAKQVMLVELIALGQIILASGLLLFGSLLKVTGLVRGAIFGPVPWGALAASAGAIFAASLIMSVIHTWVGLRWRQFTVAMGVAIVAVVAGFMFANVSQGVYFPWSMPILAIDAVFKQDGAQLSLILLLNLLGLALITPLACWDVTRRDVLE
jgi:lantibiotic transport system permease protein